MSENITNLNIGTDRKTKESANLSTYSAEAMEALEEGQRIARDPSVPGYSNIDDLKKALEE